MNVRYHVNLRVMESNHLPANKCVYSIIVNVQHPFGLMKCMSVCLLISLYSRLSAYLPVCLSACLFVSVCLSVCLNVSLSA